MQHDLHVFAMTLNEQKGGGSLTGNQQALLHGLRMCAIDFLFPPS